MTTINIEYPAIDPIANWSNIPSAWYYYPDEFRIAFTRVFEEESTTVFDVLSKFREDELKAADKLSEVKSREEDIKKRLSPKVTEDPIITKIAAPKIRALIDELKKEIDKWT
jgi:septation ring formation regulator EzrA